MNLPKIARQSSLYLFGNLANRAVGFVMIPVYTHFLTPAEYGMLELLELCIQLAVIGLGIQALGGALIRIFYDYDDERSRDAVVSSTILGTALIGATVAGIAYFSADWLSRLIFKSSTGAPLIRVAFIAMFFGNMAEIGLIYYRLRDLVGLVVAYSFVQLVVTVGLNIYFIVFRHMTIWGFMWSKLVVSGLGGTLLTIAICRKITFRWHFQAMRRIIAFAFPVILTGISIFVIHFIDRFFITRMCSLQEVGIYSLAYKFGFLISYLIGEPFSRVWNVTLYGSLSVDTWRESTAKAGRYLTFFLFLTGLTICVLAPRLMPMMADASFGRAVTIIPILVAGYIIREIGDFFKAILYVNKRTYLVSNITLFCACVNCICNLVFIGSWGITGAAWATLVTWTVYMACCWLYMEREHDIRFGLGPFVQVCALAGAVYWLAQIGRVGTSPLFLALDCILIICFCGGALAVKYVPRIDRSVIDLYLSRVRVKP